MAESNPFLQLVDGIRDYADRAVRRWVSLDRDLPDTPAEPATGWTLTVGRQRIALAPAPPAIPDTGWQPLTVLAGFTAGAGSLAPQWRVRDGWAMMRGRVTRAAGNWPTGAYTEVAATPPAAQPTRLRYTAGASNTGLPLGVAIDHRIQVHGAPSATAVLELGTIPPWRVD